MKNAYAALKSKIVSVARFQKHEPPARRGFTLIEVITVTVIIAVLAAAAIPLAHNAFQREKEIELRRALRMMRTAIDDYKKFCRGKQDRDGRGHLRLSGKTGRPGQGHRIQGQKEQDPGGQILAAHPLRPDQRQLSIGGCAPTRTNSIPAIGAGRMSGTSTAIRTKKPWTAPITATGKVAVWRRGTSIRPTPAGRGRAVVDRAAHLL